MTLRLHRAPRADQLAEALGTLLATPRRSRARRSRRTLTGWTVHLPPDDPFAQELVLVPARGVERWLSQRLSHRLGRGDTDDGVCAGVAFRSPRTLVAEVTGLRHEGGDDDPWAPDALVWPLLGVVDASAGEEWCRTLGAHLGHGQTGEEGELRRGRRYAVARRLARLFASYAVQRPRLLADWEAGALGDRRATVRAASSTPTCSGSPSSGDGWWRPSARPARSCAMPACSTSCAPDRRRPTCRRGCRCSATPGSRSRRSSCSRRSASTATCTCGCRTRPTRSGAR